MAGSPPTNTGGSGKLQKRIAKEEFADNFSLITGEQINCLPTECKKMPNNRILLVYPFKNATNAPKTLSCTFSKLKIKL